MKKTRKRLSPEVAKSLGFTVKKNDKDGRYPRYTLSKEQLSNYVESNHSPSTRDFAITTSNSSHDDVLSAKHGDTGGVMDIDTYCSFYDLPRADIRKYKLITHTGTPYYNIEFNEKQLIVEDINYDFIETLVKTHISPISYTAPIEETATFDRVIYSDAHIGMHPNKSGHSLYGGKWDADELNNSGKVIVDHILANQKSNLLILDELGDLVDGWDGQTVRKGHSLPQNMTNQEAFDNAVRFKVNMIDMLYDKYGKIKMNNICEDNHSGAFGYVVNSAVKSIVEQKYSNVEVINHMKFINHYYVGKHCFVLSHGKDSHALKFGFKPHLDPKQIEKIDQYLKQNGVYKRAEFIEFSKGDSHQMLFDYCTSDDFDYCNYPALSPSSEWVQTNFKKGRRGFVMQICDIDSKNKVIIPYLF